jgi:hypothetical protein
VVWRCPDATEGTAEICHDIAMPLTTPEDQKATNERPCCVAIPMRRERRPPCNDDTKESICKRIVFLSARLPGLRRAHRLLSAGPGANAPVGARFAPSALRPADQFLSGESTPCSHSLHRSCGVTPILGNRWHSCRSRRTSRVLRTIPRGASLVLVLQTTEQPPLAGVSKSSE